MGWVGQTGVMGFGFGLAGVDDGFHGFSLFSFFTGVNREKGGGGKLQR